MDDSINNIINASQQGNHTMDFLNKDSSDINYFSNYIDNLGFTKMAATIFFLSALIQWIWGSETCFISINIEHFCQNQDVPETLLLICICILYSMVGVGSALIGHLTFVMGRIYTINITVFIYILVTIVCSFVIRMNFYIIFFLRCIGNISIGIFVIIILNILCEFLPTKNRSLYLMINESFYNFGNLFTLILNNYYLDLDSFETYNMRIENLIITVPGIVGMILIFFWGSESPLYLFNKNYVEDGYILIEYMTNQLLTDEEKEKILKSIKLKKQYKIESKYSELFTPDYYFITLCCLVICSICHFNLIGITYLISKTLNYLEDNFYDIDYQTQMIIYGIIQLPNGFIGGIMTETQIFQRKKTIWISSLLCAIFYFLCIISIKSVGVFGGIIMLFNSICYNCSFLYVMEIFPTNLRDIAQSFIQCAAFFIGSLSPFFIGIFNHYVSYFLLGVSNIVIMMVSGMFPVDTYMRHLDSDIL
jgi:hypothetical protein